MINIIVLFYKAEEARALKSLFVKTGYNVVGVVTSGAQAIALADDLSDGIVVCGYKYPDMMYNELREKLPDYFDMLLVAGRSRWDGGYTDGIVYVEMPIKTGDLLDTLGMMAESIERRKKQRRLKPRIRSEQEAGIIKEAKKVLIERNNMTEEEAHRYMQKTSMDTGTNLVETAEMILKLM